LEFEKCTLDSFKFENKEQLTKFGLETYYCISDKRYDFKGDFYAEEFKFIELYLRPCQTKETPDPDDVVCKSDEEIKTFFGG